MSALKICANVAAVLGFGALVFASYRNFALTGSLNSLGLVAVNALFVCLYVFRRDARVIVVAPHLWVLAFAGTMLPLLMRTTAEPGLELTGSVVQGSGLCLIAAALLSLQRSFGIVPANRGIREGGLYAIVRHPLYAAELLFILGFVMVNPSPWNVGLWVIECALQVLRARAEEQLLGEDPVYSAYSQRVRYRLIPGLI